MKENGLVKVYAMLISMVGIGGMTIAFGFLINTVLDYFIFYEASSYLKEEIIGTSVWVFVFLVLFVSHFPWFLKLNRK